MRIPPDPLPQATLVPFEPERVYVLAPQTVIVRAEPPGQKLYVRQYLPLFEGTVRAEHRLVLEHLDGLAADIVDVRIGATEPSSAYLCSLTADAVTDEGLIKRRIAAWREGRSGPKEARCAPVPSEPRPAPPPNMPGLAPALKPKAPHKSDRVVRFAPLPESYFRPHL